MKKYLLFLLVVFALATFASADMTVVQKVKSGGMMGKGPSEKTITMYLKGDKFRVDDGSEPGSKYSLIDTTEKKMYMVDPAEKQIMVTSTDMMMEAGKMMGAQTKSTVEKTGNSKTINGYKCTEYIVKTTSPMMSVTGDMWVTQDIDTSEFEKFKDFAGQGMTQMFGGEELSKIKGFAIQTNSKITVMGQNTEGSTEVLSISRDPVSSSLFELPKDYKMKDMPNPGKMR
jgi:hypothetical protein